MVIGHVQPGSGASWVAEATLDSPVTETVTPAAICFCSLTLSLAKTILGIPTSQFYMIFDADFLKTLMSMQFYFQTTRVFSNDTGKGISGSSLHKEHISIVTIRYGWYGGNRGIFPGNTYKQCFLNKFFLRYDSLQFKKMKNLFLPKTL